MRRLFEVSNRFVEQVRKEMEVSKLLPEEILHKSNLSETQLIDVLRGNNVPIAHLYALIDVLPGLGKYFNSEVESPYTDKWKDIVQDLKKIREKSGESTSDQASRLGMRADEFESMEKGNYSPSFTSFRKMTEEYPVEFKSMKVSLGIPRLWEEVAGFAVRSKWSLNTLASQTRISEKRLRLIIRGAEPKSNEMKELRVFIPNLPSWVPGDLIDFKNTAKEVIENSVSNEPTFLMEEVQPSQKTIHSEIRDFAMRRKIGISQLATKMGIQKERLFEIMKGAEPAQYELQKIRVVIPDPSAMMPPVEETVKTPEVRVSLRDQLQSVIDKISPPSEPKLEVEPLPTDESVDNSTPWSDRNTQVLHDVTTPEHEVSKEMDNSVPVLTDPEPTNSESIESESEPVEPIRQTVRPVNTEAQQHIVNSLTSDERLRVSMSEDALLRLASDDQPDWRRQELFPGDSNNGLSWIREFLKKITESGVVERRGERNFTRYAGIKDRVEKLIGDQEWLLKLVVPAALSRISNQQTETDETENDSDVVESIPHNPIPSHDFMIEIMEVLPHIRVLPQYYEVLTYQHDRISSIEAKLEEILTILKGKQ